MAVAANKPDIVCIVEYWLCAYISANEVALPGYQVAIYACDKVG